MKRIIFSVLAMASTSWAMADQLSPQQQIDTVAGDLEALIMQQRVTFPQGAADQLVYMQALLTLKNVSKELAAAPAPAADPNQPDKMDKLVEELVELQGHVSAFLGEKNTFGYVLKKDPSQIKINGAAIIGGVGSKVGGVLGGILGGSVKIDTSKEIVSKFQEYRGKYLAKLAQIAGLDKTDDRARAQVAWPRSFKVIYPGGDGFGKEFWSQPECIKLFNDYDLCR
ncbi:MAG: hypothetical protein AB7P04_12485 [Bacteriovoracia bacterium]